MNNETRNYKAKAFLRYVETGEIHPPKDIVLDILRKSGDVVKISHGIYKAVQK